MEFGVFDHLDRSGPPLDAFYEARLKLAEAYDAAGFRAYHIAEHHSHPLGMAPSPNVFLSAVAQRTRRLRFGALVYPLPFYHPLRLIEEICMLDQMSGGRLECGVGHGISPVETRYYGLDPEATRRIHAETFALVTKGLTSKVLDFEGEFFRFRDVPMELEPLQKPHPPIWLGAHSPETAAWAGRRGANIVTLDGAEHARLLGERHRDGWREAHGDAPCAARHGISRFIVIAADGGEALRVARRAYPVWHRNFNHLYRRHGRGPVLGERPGDFDALMQVGGGAAGTPEEVLQVLRRQVASAGANYLVGQFAFGDVSLAEALRTIDLFARHVMPALSQ